MEADMPVNEKDLLSMAVGRRKVMQGGAALVAAASLAVARPVFAADRKRIGVGLPDRTADLYQGLIDSIQAEADKRGYEIVQSFSGSAPEKQLAELNAWIASGVDALVVLPLDANAATTVVAKAHENNIIFVGYANNVPGNDGYLKWDDTQAGTALGQLIGDFTKKNLGGKAEVAMLVFPNHQATRERIRSTKESLDKAIPGGFTYWETQAVLAPEGLTATQSLLQAHPDIKIIVCCADDGALGARAAYMNSGLSDENVFICGFDGSQQNLTLLKEKDKFIRASAALDITEVGRKVIEIPDNIFNKKQPTEVALPYVIVTHDSDPAEIDRLLAVYKKS
jgi:ribose transport system substrate-binding protein